MNERVLLSGLSDCTSLKWTGPEGRPRRAGGGPICLLLKPPRQTARAWPMVGAQ